MSEKPRVVVALLVLFICRAAFATDPSIRCDPIKFIDKQSATLSYAESLAYLNSITRETWDTAREQINAGLTLPLEIPVTANMDFDTFEKSWMKYKESTHYFRTVRDDRVTVATVASTNDASMYEACLSGATGISAFGSLVDETTLIVSISWRPTPAVGDQIIPQMVSVTLEQSGASDLPRISKAHIGINGTIERTYHLKPGVPFDLTVTEARGTSTSVHALVPKIYTCTIVTEPHTMTKYYRLDANNNKQVDAMKVEYANMWKSELEELGHKNVTVAFNGMGPERGHYTYTFNYSAKVDGSSTYGPDPRCREDEPPPPAAVK